MSRIRRRKAWLLVGLGLALGLSIGGAMTAGVLLGRSTGTNSAATTLDELKLRAVASHGNETFAIATGVVDEEVEGLFCLDFLTGDLKCYVLNNRGRGVQGYFATNVLKDISVEKGKKPAYCLVTGSIRYRGNPNTPGCLVYVADANSGNFAAYSFGWARGASSAGISQSQPMQLVFAGKARNLEIRE
ncbi:MAG: hypothetical protein MUF06_05045 [Pirellulaceae bacterium]|jgi:hypothetical protein|nr:hypothetical protein [Pirellulaceae bacterium]